MTLCTMKNNKGEPCSNKAAHGFFVEEAAVCKTHYGNYAVAKRQAEIDADAPPKEELPVPVFTPCKCKTKEGTKDEKNCENPAKNDPSYEGMCSAHYKAHMKKLAKESEPPKEEVERVACKQIIKDPKEGSKQCTQLEIEGFDGYCKRHYNLKHKTEKKTVDDKKMSELEAVQTTVLAAMAALEAAKNNIISTEDKSTTDVAVKSKSKKRESKKKNINPESFEAIVENMETENSVLLNKMPPMEGVDISNPMDDIEIPEEF
jgi:hypothetical protein